MAKWFTLKLDARKCLYQILYKTIFLSGKGGPDLFSPELIKQTATNYQSPDLPLLPELPPARNPLFREEDDDDVPEPTPAPPVPPNWSVLTRVLKTDAQDEVMFFHFLNFSMDFCNF